jgi:hypothetical protein
MSTAEREGAGRDEAAESEPKDWRKPLTQRELFALYLRDRDVRPYLLAALGSLAMVFLVMFLAGSDVGAVVVALFGLATVLFRWVAGPPLLLLFLAYFQLFPFAVPDVFGLLDDPREISRTHFQVADVILVMAVLVYVRSAYRLFGLTHQALPFESLFRRKGEHPARRPLWHVRPSEVAWMVGGAAALVIVGQLVWWLVNNLEFAPAEEGFPLRWADAESFSRYRRGGREAGEFRPGANRFFVTVGALFFGLLLLRLVFGYWRMRVMGAAEGAMMLSDTSWSESHRERVRVEKWRIWGRERAKARAKKEAQTERERHEKEAAARARAERQERDREQRRAARERRRDRRAGSASTTRGRPTAAETPPRPARIPGCSPATRPTAPRSRVPPPRRPSTRSRRAGRATAAGASGARPCAGRGSRRAAPGASARRGGTRSGRRPAPPSPRSRRRPGSASG